MRRLGALLLICLLVATGLGTISDPSPARAVIATVLVNDAFTGAVIADPAVRATGSTCLTGAAQGSTPPAGVSPIGGCPAGLAGPIPPLGTQPGYLLLTDAANNRAGNLFYNRPIPSSAGIEAQFEIYMYGGSGADGITFFLVDGATELTATGGLGGSLGYAQRNLEPGVLGGYVGIGFDVYGNYYDDGEGRGRGCPTGQQSPSSQSGAIAPNTVVVRGPGSNITGYCYLASTTNPASNPNRPTSTLPGRLAGTTLANAKRIVNLVITPAPSPTITVQIDFNDGAGFRTVIGPIPAPPNPPQTYKFGFSGSTGGSTDVHLVRNALVGTRVALGELNLVKQVDRSGAPLPAVITAGTTIPYQFVVTNAGLTTLPSPTIADPLVTNVVCPPGDMLPGAVPSSTKVCTGSYVVTPADVAAGVVVNTAIASAGGIDSNQSSVTVPLSSGLTVAKSATTTGPYTIGQNINYSYVVTNSGGSTLSNVAVTDNRVATVTCPLSTLTPGQAMTCTGSYALRAIDIAATGTLTNTAFARGVTPIGQSVQSPNVTAAVAVSADIAVTKTVDNANPIEGQNIVYTITATNNGPSNAVNVVVGAPAPAGTTNVGFVAAPGTTFVAATGLWTIPALAVGQSVVLTETDRVDTAGTIVNGATVRSSAQPDPDPSNNSASVTVNAVVPTTDLAVTKVVSSPSIRVGQSIGAQITIANNGPFDATGVTVRDPLPLAVTFVSASGDGSYDAASGIWTVGDLPVGQSRTVTVIGLANSMGFVINTASLNTVAPIDNNAANDVAVATFDISAPLADLAVTKIVRPGDNAIVGEQVAYVVTATNNGPDAATNVTVLESLPDGLAFVSSEAEVGAFDPVTGIWAIPLLLPGTSVRLQIFMTAVATGFQGNQAVIGSPDVTDPDGSNNAATAGVQVSPVPPPPVDVGITKVAGLTGPATFGQTVSFTLQASNAGPNAATNVTFTDVLPPGLTFVSAIPSAGTTFADGVWSLPTLAVGATPTLALTTIVTTGPGTYTNSVALSAVDQTDTNDQNNGASASVQVFAESDLSVTKSVTPSTAAPGDEVTYTVVVTNNGSDDNTGVQLLETNRTPAVFTNVVISQGTFDQVSRVWTVGDLAVGASARIDVTIRIQRGGTIVNRVVVFTADLPDPNLLNNTATATLLAPAADLVVTKTASTANATVGDTVTFTVGVANIGPDTAPSAIVTDALPAGFVLVSATPSVGTFTGSTWTLGDFDPGSSATLTLVARATAAGTLTNTASATSALPDPDPANNSASATVVVVAAPVPPPPPSAELSLTKTVSTSSAFVGSAVTFTLRAVNLGPDAATGVVIRDPFPEGLTPISASPECVIAGQVVTCTQSSLAVGSTFSVDVIARVDAVADFVNVATATSETSGAVSPSVESQAGVLGQSMGTGGLPATGGDFRTMLLIGLVLTVIGGIAALLSRRRPPSTDAAT